MVVETTEVGSATEVVNSSYSERFCCRRRGRLAAGLYLVWASRGGQFRTFSGEECPPRRQEYFARSLILLSTAFPFPLAQ